MPRLIAISGKMCSGKDTVVSELIQRYGGVRMGFADPLKKELQALIFRLTGDWVDPWSDKSDGLRAALQQFGTGLRSYRSDFWIRLSLNEAKRKLLSGQNVYFSDCRFPNEAQTVLDNGGEVWRVDRPRFERLDTIRQMYGRIDPQRLIHESETALDGFDNFSRRISASSLTELLAQITIDCQKSKPGAA